MTELGKVPNYRLPGDYGKPHEPDIDEPEVMYLVRSVKVLTTEYVYGLFRNRGRAEFEASERNRRNPWAGAVVHPIIVQESLVARRNLT